MSQSNSKKLADIAAFNTHLNEHGQRILHTAHHMTMNEPNAAAIKNEPFEADLEVYWVDREYLAYCPKRNVCFTVFPSDFNRALAAGKAIHKPGTTDYEMKGTFKFVKRNVRIGIVPVA